MKVVWFFLSASVLLALVGFLTQSIMWPNNDSLAMVPATGSAPLVVEEAEMELPSDTAVEDGRNMVDEEETKPGIDKASPPPSSSTVRGTVLFEYDADEPAWYTVNDDVMGGVSTSTVSTDAETQRLIFSGNLSLENSGGFASIRSQWSSYDLTGSDGIVLRVLGDGRAYQFRIRTEQTGSEIAYTALFRTEAGVWKDIYISFAEMIPVYRGVVVGRAPALDPGSIRSFGLMLADKQQGEFLLEVERISAVAASNLQV